MLHQSLNAPRFFLNTIQGIHVPYPLCPVVPAMPAGALHRPIRCRVEIVPVAGAVLRVAYAAIPAVPAGAGIPIPVKQIPVMIDDIPGIGRIGPILPAVPPAVVILNPSYAFFRGPGFHERLRIGVYLFNPGRAASPVRKLEMRFVHNGLPVPAPFQAQGRADGSHTGKEIPGIVIGPSAVIPENVECSASLMVRTVTASGRIGHNTARLSASLGIQGVLLRHGPQRLTDFYHQSLFSALLHQLHCQKLQTGMA